MNNLSIKACLSFGWRTFKARPWFFVGTTAIILFVSLMSGLFQAALTSILGNALGGAFSSLVALIVDTFIGMGFVLVYLKAHDSVMAPSLSDLWHPKHFVRFILAYLLVSIILLVGFLLLIVPGVILLLMFCFTTTLVIDRGLHPIEALKESARITKGHRLQLLALILATVGVNILGAVALFIGLFVTIPVTMLALIHAYRTLAVAAPAR